MGKRRRAALDDHGYTVLPLVDAMTDLNADAHRHGVENVFPLISETATTIDMLALLRPRCRQEDGGGEVCDIAPRAHRFSKRLQCRQHVYIDSKNRDAKVCSGERSNFDRHRPKS